MTQWIETLPYPGPVREPYLWKGAASPKDAIPGDKWLDNTSDLVFKLNEDGIWNIWGRQL